MCVCVCVFALPHTSLSDSCSSAGELVLPSSEFEVKSMLSSSHGLHPPLASLFAPTRSLSLSLPILSPYTTILFVIS